MNLEYLKNHVPSLGLDKYFDEAQRYKNDHPAIISSMYKLKRKANEKLFLVEFLQCIIVALAQKEKSPLSIAVLDFAAKFCCHHSKHVPEDCSDLFLVTVVKLVTHLSNSKSTVVRLRSCEFCNFFLASMPVEATVDVEILEEITECMINKTKDKLATVRVHACSALQRLQEPQNKDCPVIQAFVYHLECDPSAEVRRDILKNIAITPHTLPAIISRSRDYSEIVRKEMYQAISKVSIKRFRILQRQEILSNGLNDSSEIVKDYIIKKLIPTWLDNCEKDYLILLKYFYVQSYNLESVMALLFNLFKRQASADLLDMVKSWQNADRVIPFQDLTTEKAVIWLAVVKYFKNPPSDVKIDSESVKDVLPELTYLSKYIQEFSAKYIICDSIDEKDISSYNYIFLRLLDLVLLYTVEDDEKGREEMKNICRELLLSNFVSNDDMVILLTKLTSFLIPDVDERLQLIAMTISDIQHPLEDEPSKNTSDIVEESFENLRLTCTSETTHTESLQFSNIEMLPKCLLMIIESLKAKDVDRLYPVLDTLQKHFLVQCFELNKGYISSLSISALSLICLLDPEVAKANFIKFLFTLEVDELKLSSLEAIFDQLIFYGLDICQITVKENPKDRNKNVYKDASLDFYSDPTLSRNSDKHLIDRLSESLFYKDLCIRAVACQGFAKLLLTNRINSYYALAKLVILWFSPDYGSDSCISQPLGIFFDLYAKKIKNAGEVILNSIIPALDYLASDECDQSLATVEPNRVAILLLDSLNKVPNPEEGPSYHFQAANLICDELLTRGIKSEVSLILTLSKCLNYLELKKLDKEYSEAILEKLPSVLLKIDKLKEKSVKKIALNFSSKLHSLWGLKKSNPTASRTEIQVEKSNGTQKKDAVDDHQNDFSNITIRRHSKFTSSEPIIEEFSEASEEEDIVMGDDTSGQPGNEVVPGTPESSEELDSDENSKPPPTRRKQRKLNF